MSIWNDSSITHLLPTAVFLSSAPGHGDRNLGDAQQAAAVGGGRIHSTRPFLSAFGAVGS